MTDDVSRRSRSLPTASRVLLIAEAASIHAYLARDQQSAPKEIAPQVVATA